MSQDILAAGADAIEAALAPLRAAGRRITTARRVLLAVLSENRAHRSAGELAADVQSRAPRTNLSTIYRNLEADDGAVACCRGVLMLRRPV